MASANTARAAQRLRGGRGAGAAAGANVNEGNGRSELFLTDQLLDLGHDAALGEADRGDVHGQLVGHRPGLLPLHGCFPEGPPGVLFHGLSYLGAGPLKELPFMGLLPSAVLFRRRLLAQALEHAGVAGALGMTAVGGEETEQLAVNDGEQPAAESAAPRIIIQPAHGPRHGAQHLLGEVGRIVVLKAALARVAVNQRRVDLGELRPGPAIARVANAEKQACTGLWRSGHVAVPPRTSRHADAECIIHRADWTS
jgi:hypothetical protein